MKFASWLHDQTEEAGILADDLASVHSFESAGLEYDDLDDFIEWHTEEDMAALRALAARPGLPIEGVQLQAPIPRPRHDIICLGLNYADHEKEAAAIDGKMAPEHAAPVFFSKRVVEAVGPDGVIEGHFDLNDRLDYEAELAVVLSGGGRDIPAGEARRHIFGLMCFNDVSGRDAQFRHGQWFFGKSMDGFTAYGPYIATADEFEWPLRLRVRSRVNGEGWQDGNTADMIHSVEEIIAELSRGITLDAGTIIATGTPAGVGGGYDPPRYMQPGDVVEIEVEGCGVLRNTVE